jgi:hypothetical protein
VSYRRAGIWTDRPAGPEILGLPEMAGYRPADNSAGPHAQNWLKRIGIAAAVDLAAFVGAESGEVPFISWGGTDPGDGADPADGPDGPELNESTMSEERPCQRLSWPLIAAIVATPGRRRRYRLPPAPAVYHLAAVYHPRPHGALTKQNDGRKTTPAMAAGVSKRVWTFHDIAALLD